MNDLDDFELGRRLRAAAGSDPDVGAAQQVVGRRVGRARKRRMAAVSGTAAALVLGIGLFAAVGDDGGAGRVQTAEPGPDESSIDSTATSSSDPASTSSSAPTSKPDASTSTVAATAPPAPADVTETYTSPGGSITVRLSGGTLQLLGVSPAAGFVEERRVLEGDDVEVRFRSDTDQARIRVRIENGQMVRTE